MGGGYLGFVAAAYGLSALALFGLGAFVFLDSLRTARRLRALEEGLGRRRGRDERA